MPCNIIRAVFLLEWIAALATADKQLIVSLGASGLEAKLALFADTGQILLLDVQQVSELLPRGFLLRLEVSARGHSRLQVGCGGAGSSNSLGRATVLLVGRLPVFLPRNQANCRISAQAFVLVSVSSGLD